jgi:addiction module HigA family antidote
MTMHNPAHPGEILKELVIDSLALTITDAAKHLDVSRKTLSKVLNARGAVTPQMAVRLELVFGKPSLNANNDGIRIDHNLGVVCRWAGIVLTIVAQV